MTIGCEDGAPAGVGAGACDVDLQANGLCTFDFSSFGSNVEVPIGETRVIHRSDSWGAGFTQYTLQCVGRPTRIVAFSGEWAPDPFMVLAVQGCSEPTDTGHRVRGSFFCGPTMNCPTPSGDIVIGFSGGGYVTAEAHFTNGVFCFFLDSPTQIATHFACRNASGDLFSSGWFEMHPGRHRPC